LITGDGRIEGPFINAIGGELRAQAGRSLALVGVGNTNDGLIKLVGGELDFAGDLTNNAGAVISGNGSLFVAGGLTNLGTMNFAGTANVTGSVANLAGGKIISAGGGATIFYDSVVNDGEIRTSANAFTIFFGSVSGSGTFTGTGTVNFEGDLNPGNSPAIVNFGGDVVLGADSTLKIEIGGATPGTSYDQVNVAGQLSLAGALEISLIDGFVPTAGQTFDILNAASLVGAFSSIELPTIPGLTWNTSQLASGILSVVPGLLGDYNEDGTVNAADYTVYRNRLAGIGGTTLPNDDTVGVGPDDYLRWKNNYGNSSGAAAGLLSQAQTVPEPNSCVLSLAFLVAAAFQPRSRARNVIASPPICFHKL
jgi:hypothetical protein